MGDENSPQRKPKRPRAIAPTTTSQIVSDLASGTISVQIVGDGNTVVIGIAHLVLVPLERRLRTPKPGRELHLIDPRCRSIPLVARDEDLTNLWSWLHDATKPVSIRVVTGRAGAGKTRIALELLARLNTDAPGTWSAGFVTGDELRRFAAQSNLSAWGWQKPTLLIVDYACALVEPLRTWINQLAETPADRPPIRLLLLEREATTEHGWLRALQECGEYLDRVKDLFDPPEPVTLRPVGTADERRTLLRNMLEAYTAFTGKKVADLPPLGGDREFDERLRADQWSDPLYLMMAVLVAPERGLREALSLHRADLALQVAEHERHRLDASVDTSTPGTDNRRYLIRHLAAFATVCGGLDAEQARAASEAECAALKRIYPDGPGALADRVAQLMPHFNGGIAAILPDIVGEAFVLSIWTCEKPEHQKNAILRASQQRASNTAEFLTRAFQDFSAPEHAKYATALLDCVDNLIEAGQSGDVRLLMAIESAIPSKTTELRDRAVRLNQTLLTRMGTASDGAASEVLRGETARIHNNLGVRLSYVGRLEDALAAAEEAVRLRRELARARPDAFVPDLAISLNNLANRLSELGRREDAFAAAEEALRLFRELASVRPDAFVPHLATLLSNVTNLLSDLGRRSDALAAAEETVRLHRELARARPDSYVPALAVSLNNQANKLSDLGRCEEALAAAEDAVRIHRELAHARPDAFLPDLAMTLTNAATLWSELGRNKESLAAAEEAVYLYRELDRARPDAFVPSLAGSLNNVASRLSNLGRREDALAAAKEAVRLYRELAGARPGAFVPDLAMSLNNVANRFSALGRHEDAVAAAKEAASLYRELARARPDTFVPNLSKSLAVLGKCHRAATSLAEALAASKTALETLLPAFKKLPQAHLSLFKAILRNYFQSAEDANAPLDAELVTDAMAALAPFLPMQPQSDVGGEAKA